MKTDDDIFVDYPKLAHNLIPRARTSMLMINSFFVSLISSVNSAFRRRCIKLTFSDLYSGSCLRAFGGFYGEPIWK